MALYVEGRDNRKGITASDGTAITLFTNGAVASNEYLITARTFLTVYSSGNVVYTISWTENGSARTYVTTANTAINTIQGGWMVIRPDANSAITGQLTGMAGSNANTCNVFAAVIQIF